KRAVRTEAAVHFVRRNLDELRNFVAPGCLQQAPRAFDICANEGSRIQNRTVDVRFSCKIHDAIELVAFEYIPDLSGVCDVASGEFVSRVGCHFLDVPQITCVSQKVIIHNLDVGTCAQDISNEAGSDEPGSSCNENLHCCLSMDAEVWMAA